ncbi:MAG TPA: hypothetical protein DCQ37_02185 [Desulfobacteraceae bacterium]|nr:hypothetical protein [Desulfobacteraceae bacterium]
MTELKISDPMLRRIIHWLGIMAVIITGFYTFGLLRDAIILILNILSPFIIALLLAYILAPVVMALQHRLRLGRIMGTLVLYLLVFLFIALVLAVLIPKVLSELIDLFNTIRDAVPGLLDKLSQNKYLKLDVNLIRVIQDKVSEAKIDYEKLVENILPRLKDVASGGLIAVGKATVGIFTGLGWTISFFSFLSFVIIINFYFIADWEEIAPLLRKMVPPMHRERVFDVTEKMDKAVGGFLRGQLTISAIVGSLFAIGLFGIGFIGFPALRNYSVLIGTAAAIGGFIPYLGAVIGVTPAILIVLLTGGLTWEVKLMSLGAVLVLFGAIHATEGFILQPRIVGKGAGLHPLVVMLALIAGSQFGIGGMIIAIPVAGIIRVLVQEFFWLPIERREAQLSEKSDV